MNRPALLEAKDAVLPLECGSLLPLYPPRACSRSYRCAQQAGLKESGSKLPHSKTSGLAGRGMRVGKPRSPRRISVSQEIRSTLPDQKNGHGIAGRRKPWYTPLESLQPPVITSASVL